MQTKITLHQGIELIPLDHFARDGKVTKHDSREFLSAVLFDVLNTMGDDGEDVNLSEFLQVTDIDVFRGSNVVIVTFSRKCRLNKPTISEMPLSEAVPDEKNIVVTKAEYYTDPSWHKRTDFDEFTSPFSIVFPTSFCPSR